MVQPLNPYASPQAPPGIAAQAHRLDTLGDLLLTGISLFINNAWALIGVTLVFCGPLELLRTYHYYYIAEADGAQQPLPVFWIVEELVRLISFGGFIAIGHAAMEGRRPTIWYGLRAGIEAWPRLVATDIVVGLISLLGMLVLVVPGIYVMVRSALAGQVAVIERASGLASMKRSFELTAGQSWRYLALLIVLIGAAFLASALVWLVMWNFPQLNQWLVAAAFSLLIDALSGWTRLVLVAAYWSTAGPRSTGESASGPGQAQ